MTGYNKYYVKYYFITHIYPVLQDPYNLKVIKRGEGTKSQPNEISSASEARIVGCVCEIDSYHVKWMWIHSGEPKYYYCGSYWFKLVYKEALK